MSDSLDPIAAAERIIRNALTCTGEVPAIDWSKDPRDEWEKRLRVAMLVVIEQKIRPQGAVFWVGALRDMTESYHYGKDIRAELDRANKIWQAEKLRKKGLDTATLAREVMNLGITLGPAVAASESRPVVLGQARPPEPHECIPAIVEPDVSKVALSAGKALAALILEEAKNLRMLRRLHEIACEVHKDPKALSDEVRQELHAAFNVMDMRYDSSGQNVAMEELSVLGEIAKEAIGTVSGDHILLSNGKFDVARYGHVGLYLTGAKDIHKAIDSETCELCRPNFIAMIDDDIARGLIRVTDGRYEWTGK